MNNWYRSKFMPGNVRRGCEERRAGKKGSRSGGERAEQLRQHAVDSAKLGVKSFFKRLPDNVFTGETAKTYDVHVDLDPKHLFGLGRPH